MTIDCPALELSRVRLRLSVGGPLFAVDELSVAPGARMAVVGPSGCGKSTLLGLAGGITRAEEGRVAVHGTNLQDLGAAELDSFRGQHIGFVFQSFNLLEAFTSEENVRLGMGFGQKIPRADQRDRARTLLDQVGVGHRAHARPGRLSIGERQRVAIARAVSGRPTLLLADEPTGSLDPANARKVHELLLRVCAEEKCALVYVTHDSHLATDFEHKFDASRLLVQEGAPAS
jgi:putative ABC transport system ATP-binding protein